jgi:sulfotransferase family protein
MAAVAYAPMTLRVVGAGLGRTGTHSLKNALELLLGGPCYHMIEVFGRPDDIAVWHDAIKGDPPDWNTFLAEYESAVDWPACSFWREISAANPGATILLSTRESADAWWKSASQTIFQVANQPPTDDPMLEQQRAMALDMFSVTFTPNWQDETEAKRAYEAHNADVRASVPADKLIDWQPRDGWAPICAQLGLPVPTEPFPHVNTTDDFRAMLGMEPLS